jgi:2-oxoglutarate dehydrogenase E2 component (dihydrolipoamide succinyltransferase)
MILEVKIPPMGESISSGVLAKWHVKDGDIVKKDQPLFELETDKITSEGTAESAGKISLKAAAGAEVKIGELVATIDSDVVAGAAGPGPGSTSPATSAAKEGTQSPAVRRLAEETGVDPASVAGTGKAGRVTKGDMLAAGEKPAAPAAPAPAPAAPAPAAATPAAPAVAPKPAAPTGARQTRKKMTPLRQKIAQRLVAAQHEAAMLTTFNEVDMSAVMALRSKYQDDFVKKNGFKLGFMSFFAKAVVNALKEIPGINAQIDGTEIVQNNYYDIGVAVSTEKGLMVPVIRDCDTLSMAGIEKAIGDVAKRARDGKITLADLEGGVFTITNGGTFGSMLSTPIINAPQSAILGLHAINDRPVAVNGQVVIRPMMYLALSYDHRLVDGKEAVTFLVKVKQAIEDPARLLLAI